MNEILAVVRVRGIRNMAPKVKITLEHLRLNKPNHCIVIKATPEVFGMLLEVKDYVAFGKISESALHALLQKRGEVGSKLLCDLKKEEEIKAIAKEMLAGKRPAELDKVFRLHPPRSGYKNIKMHYPRGDLGHRENMDDLIKRMI